MRKVMGNGARGGYSREGRMAEYERFGLRMSSPYDMGLLLEKIERGEVVSKEASKEMLAILKNQQFKTGIGRHLPGEIVASKSGSLDRLRSDVGIVHSTGGRMVIAVTVDGMLRTDYSPDNGGGALSSGFSATRRGGLSARV